MHDISGPALLFLIVSITDYHKNQQVNQCLERVSFHNLELKCDCRKLLHIFTCRSRI